MILWMGDISSVSSTASVSVLLWNLSDAASPPESNIFIAFTRALLYAVMKLKPSSL